MVWIGPRPLLVHYFEIYSEEQHHRHDVKSGLTGYAQANGRNTIGWDAKFAMDLDYVNKITFVWDIKIVFDTIKVVLKKDGISSETSVTTEEFWGEKIGSSSNLVGNRYSYHRFQGGIVVVKQRYVKGATLHFMEPLDIPLLHNIWVTKESMDSAATPLL